MDTGKAGLPATRSRLGEGVVDRGPTRASSDFAARLGQRGEESAPFGEGVHPGGQRAVPVTGGVVRFDGEDAAIRARDARELAQRSETSATCWRTATQKVESNVASGNGRWQASAALNEARRLSPSVVRSAMMRPLDQPVDADQRHLRHAAAARADSTLPVPQPTSRIRLPARGRSRSTRNEVNASSHQSSRTCFSVAEVSASSVRAGAAVSLIFHWPSQPRIFTGRRLAMAELKLTLSHCIDSI